jgi:hypothetical protein
LPESKPLWIDYSEGSVGFRDAVFARPGIVAATSGVAVPQTLRNGGARTVYWHMKLGALVGTTTAPADPATDLLRALQSRGARPFLLVNPLPYTGGDAVDWWRQVAQVADIVPEVYFNAPAVMQQGVILGSRRMGQPHACTSGPAIRRCATGPGAAGPDFGASRTEGQIALPPGIQCSLDGRLLRQIDLSRMTAVTHDRDVAFTVLYDRLVESGLARIPADRVTEAIQAIVGGCSPAAGPPTAARSQGRQASRWPQPPPPRSSGSPRGLRRRSPPVSARTP